MRMIPSQPFDNESKAELRLFDLLRKTFNGPDQNGWFAMHSLNLPRHERKRFGEIDFLVCGPGGLFVLEVKGGRVSCSNGVWETINRYNEVIRLKESPFNQAETALHGLIKKLPAAQSNGIVVGYGVVVPDVNKLPDSSEWDRPVYADSKDIKQFESWLSKFIKHWRAKSNKTRDITSARLDELRQTLRPDFEAIVPLHVTAGDVESRIARLTEEQFIFIDVVVANARVMCTGGAGTGKTMLALELAKRWGALNMKTALVCHSPWLKSFLEWHAVPGLTVCLASSIKTNAKRAGVEKFDGLIVDEGQDLLSMDVLDNLDSFLEGGLGSGKWCFFHDVNNQAGLCGAYDPEAYEYLKSNGPVPVPLTKNCRNSLPILLKIQNDLSADVGNSGVGDGPAVREMQSQDNDSVAQSVEKELYDLINVEGFNLGDIVILSPFSFNDSSLASLSDDMQAKISVLDDTSPRNIRRSTIGFAQISDFKGLESEVIVLIDMPKPGASEELLAQHYVGMSRARALLSMVYL